MPACPSPVAAAPVKETAPNWVSGRVRQPPAGSQAEGVSAIHSAEERSGSATGTRLVKRTRRVLFVTWRITCVPETSTAAVMRSPGATLTRIGTAGAGTISYQSR